jgi:hypothetical protein
MDMAGSAKLIRNRSIVVRDEITFNAVLVELIAFSTNIESGPVGRLLSAS